MGVTRLSSASYPARARYCELQVFTSPPADKKYEELAIIDIATGQTVFDGKDLQAMMPDIKAAACKVGADGVIVRNVEAGGTPWFHETQGKASAVAIKLAQ